MGMDTQQLPPHVANALEIVAAFLREKRPRADDYALLQVILPPRDEAWDATVHYGDMEAIQALAEEGLEGGGEEPPTNGPPRKKH